MPIVFTSAIGLSDKKLQGEFHGNGISQTPQVFIDCQVMDGEYGLQADWDVRNGVFPDGLIKDMFETFRILPDLVYMAYLLLRLLRM